MAREYRLSPASTLADVSDRAARLLGGVNIQRTDGSTPATTTNLNADGLGPTSNGLITISEAAAFDGTNWNKQRSLIAGAPKFALGVGTRVEQAVYGPAYRQGVDLLRAVAAINQFNQYRLRNPAASGKTVFVTYVGAEHSAARRFAMQRPIAQAADRTTVIVTRERGVGAAANVAVFSVDNNVAANLTPADLHGEVLAAGVMRDYVQPFAIEQGEAVEIEVGDIGDAAGETSTLNVEWYEE